jgi:propionaldehyde dehydrogenase
MAELDVDPRRVEAIVQQVLEQLEARERGGAAGTRGGLVGLHPTPEAAVDAAQGAFTRFALTPLETRKAIIASIRATMAAQYRTLAELAVEETGLGRVEDKILKNRIVTERTPGVEDLEPRTWTGDHGLTLEERAPYGPIVAVAPVTNPSETVINNGISMIAGGNTVIVCPHPSARRVSSLTLDLMNRAALRAGAPQPLLHAVEQPSLEATQALLRWRGIRLNVVTGGPAVVKEALAAGKKAITAGPGNPPAVVDETADIEKAARDIGAGHALDNNVICTCEKEVVCVALVADALKETMARDRAVVLPPHQIAKLRGMLLESEHGPRRPAGVNRRYVGKDIQLILGEAGIPCPPEKRYALCEVDADHPFLWTEMMMPVLPLVRVRTVDEAIDFAVEVEQGNRHTATMHSRNIEKLSKMARACDCSIFVKNGPNYAGLGFGGEGPTSFTIASPTGEGMTTARTFTRLRRCVLVDYFRIV